MATQRYISTGFWSDKWIRTLDPSERYVYLYLMTNEHTNIAGIYQLTIDRISFDTGYNEKTILGILEKFEKSGKVFFIDHEWIVIPSWPKHQKIKVRDNNRKGIDSILMEIPDNIYSLLESIKYNYLYLKEIPRPFKPLIRPLNYIESDIDIELEIESDFELEKDTKPNGATPEKKPDYPWKEVIDYLNHKAGKSFRYGDEHKTHIIARFNSGATFDDFKKVIDTKCAGWLNDASMDAYLRPKTLFGAKFDNYLNEKPRDALKPPGLKVNERTAFLDLEE